MKKKSRHITHIQNKLYLPAFIILVTFVSCEKKLDWKLNNSQEQFLIVDGIITNEYKYQAINLSLSFSNLNGTKKIVDTATVSVSDGNNIFDFHKDTILIGNFVSDNKFSGVINKTYNLNIHYKDKNYSASTSMLPVAISNPLPYKQLSDTNMFYIAADVASFNPSQASMFEVSLDWSNVSGYEDLPINKTTAKIFYYNLTTIDVNQIFSPSHENVFFPSGTKMTQIKYSLSPEHEEFIRSLLSETQWHGGYFDIEEGNVYSNLSNNAFGFFGASSIISYSTTIN